VLRAVACCRDVLIQTKSPLISERAFLLSSGEFQLSEGDLCRDDDKRLGISDKLIRLSVGIEATEDLIADLEQALENVKKGDTAAAKVR
jgi:hypothetical protein